mmetsp:Transcript_23827/g.48675  ORF Transcript_23827/g.48675 Transcript_23827/m.48675 type:complete len:147 (+) Transcript_23827:35-475(+)
MQGLMALCFCLGRSPQPFDDLYIHPVEAFGYYCILWAPFPLANPNSWRGQHVSANVAVNDRYSPPFVLPLHVGGFAVYMAVMGLCGVLDHSGIKCCVAGLYSTDDHDKHHQHYNVNFASGPARLVVPLTHHWPREPERLKGRFFVV